jgi:hypothetical protein
MKIPEDPENAQERLKGTMTGELGKGFAEVREIQSPPGIQAECIPKSELENGVYYLGYCRNATVARWNASKRCFYHWRTKFGHTLVETIKHPDDENVADVFYPFKKIVSPEKEIPFEETA